MASPIKLTPDTLAAQLLSAAFAIDLVRQGSALPQALAAVWEKHPMPPAARGAVQDLAYRSMRQWGRAAALLELLTDKQPEPPLLYSLLGCSLALLCQDDAPYTEFTVVDQAVRAAASQRKTMHAKGMVNAVLRRYLRERASLLDHVMQTPQARWNYPDWWIEAMQAAYPAQWQQILEVGNSMPPMSLRVNLRRTTVIAYLKELADAGIAASQIGAVAVRLDQARPVHEIPGFSEGRVSVQDAAAQLAAPLLDLQNGQRVLDACAAPGGKTGHLLESADIDLLALDRDAQRLRRIDENLKRLQLQAQIKLGDAGAADWWDGRPFDRILADVPCTASGIVRRHPDIRWLRRPEDAAQLATLSTRILDNLWQMLKPGGKLLLVTCSLWPEESELQAAAFAERHQAKPCAAPGQLLPLANKNDDHDGLFYALFQKN